MTETQVIKKLKYVFQRVPDLEAKMNYFESRAETSEWCGTMSEASSPILSEVKWMKGTNCLYHTIYQWILFTINY